MEHSKPPNNATEAFEHLVAQSSEGKYVLRLYVTGLTPRSTQAIATIKAICEEHLSGRYDLEVIDIYQQPTLAQGADHRRAHPDQEAPAALAPPDR